MKGETGATGAKTNRGQSGVRRGEKFPFGNLKEERQPRRSNCYSEVTLRGLHSVVSKSLIFRVICRCEWIFRCILYPCIC